MASIPKEPAFVKKQWEIEPESATPVAQQAPAQPGDGSEDYRPPELQAEQVPKEVPFGQRVIGYAKKTRGTLLAKKDLKEEGERILGGEITYEPKGTE